MHSHLLVNSLTPSSAERIVEVLIATVESEFQEPRVINLTRGFFWPFGPFTQNNTNMKRTNTNLLHKELSYILQGCVFEIRKEYGSGHKETVYKNLLTDYLSEKQILVQKEKSIKVCSNKTGKVVGAYRPDLLVDDKIIVEIKATKGTAKQYEKQLYHYLKNSKYELGYLVNFGTPRLAIKRIIYTNDHKPCMKTTS